MTRKNHSLLLVMVVLFMLNATGCAFKIVRPQPVMVKSPENGVLREVRYPAYVLTHDAQSFWDVHQIKDNITGLFDTEIVHWLDMPLDAVIPGPRRRPVESGIEHIKNGYAQLPDCAPVRIVDGLFSAVGIEKTTLLRTAANVAVSGGPVSYLTFTRVVYLTDWVQETLGEVNHAGGYLVPWQGSFIPATVTAPVNRGVDWTQHGAIALYVRVFHKISVGLDDALYGGEWMWGKCISLFVPAGKPVKQLP